MLRLIYQRRQEYGEIIKFCRASQYSVLMFRSLMILNLILAAYLISERSVERYDEEREREKQRMQEMILEEKRRLMDQVDELRSKSR